MSGENLSLRSESNVGNDGFTYFGSSLTDIVDGLEIDVNDFIINNKNDKCLGRHF